MKMWARKSLFVVVSILTFGLITPTQLMNAVNAQKPSELDVVEAQSHQVVISYGKGILEESESDRQKFLREIIKQAEMQSYRKFGSRIKPVIENEFRDIILPNIETAIEETAIQFPEEDLKSLTITETPSGGHSEKIFHIKNRLTGKDIVRFHVRRDQPPQAGYWFNFHYHTYHDQFQTHHNLGSIYWDKNTPPKWMS